MTDLGTDFAELKAGIVKTILARRITLGVFSCVALAVLLFTGISYLNPVFYAPVAWFLLTFPFKRLIEGQRSLASLHWIHTGFFIVEAGLITVLVHFMGGSEWIGSVFYLFTVIYANFFLPRLHGGLVTGVVVALYSGLVLLEHAGVVPHRSLFPLAVEPYRSLSYNLATILAGSAGLYAVVAFTVRTFNGIYARKNRLLAARERELAEMSKRLLTAQDEERRRIARGLHDELIQSLAAVKLRLSPLRQRLGESDHREVAKIVDRAISETRTLAYSLRPPLLDELGLIPSLKRLAESVEDENDLIICFESIAVGRFDVSVESLLFYAAHEALRNVVRHARASRVDLTLRREGAAAFLSIRDDGVGFRLGDHQGMGLAGIRERVEVSGGRMTLSAAPGSGTQLVVEVPCDADSSPGR